METGERSGNGWGGGERWEEEAENCEIQKYLIFFLEKNLNQCNCNALEGFFDSKESKWSSEKKKYCSWNLFTERKI